MKTKAMALAVVVLMMASAGLAQDTSALHPPAGSQVALVVFEDLECPMCAQADPLLVQAERNYGVPLVRHDFVLTYHPWSKEAHVMARYFDAQSLQLGEAFRQYIFANQNAIYKANLREKVDQFCVAHMMPMLPQTYDPTGALAAKVEADTQLGKATGINKTPTIYVVSSSPQMPFVEVTDQSKLFQTIEQAKAAAQVKKAATK